MPGVGIPGWNLGVGLVPMSHSSIQPVPAPRPMTDPGTCPFCLRSVYSLREGKGHRYPCPCPDIERAPDRWNQYAVEAREDAEQNRANPPEPRWQDIDNPFWVEEF